MTDLAALSADIHWPDHDASTRANDSLLTRPGLGQLTSLVEWVAGTRSRYPAGTIDRARLIVFAADHAVTAAGVSAYAPGTTDRAVTAISSGDAALNALAELAGASVRVERLADTTGRIDTGPAMTDDEVSAAVRRGAAIADEEIDGGADLLIAGNIGSGSTTAAAVIVSILTATEPAKVTGRGGSRIDDTTWMAKVSAVRDARRRSWPLRSNPQALIAGCGGPDIAALAGLLVQAATRRTPVLLDGAVAAAAALVANTGQPRVERWWRAAQRTGEPAHELALTRLEQKPILDLGMPVGDGTGGLLALSIVRAALASAAVPM